MAAASIPVKQLDDITECPICTELYTDPRVLPCIHTFCFKCIEKWGSDKIHDEKLACPVCRKEINVTKEGLADLPKNFFVGKLLEVRKLASDLSVKETLCDVCTDYPGKQSAVSGVQAVVHCIECRKNLCPSCQWNHQKFFSSTSHKLLELAKQENVEELFQKFPENVCDKHPDKNVEIYCSACKLVTCMMCYITSHNGHTCSDVKQVADEMSRQMKADTDSFNGKVVQCAELIQKLEKERQVFVENVSKTEMEITQKAEQLKQMIEDYKVKLLDELSSACKQQEKKMESVRDELEGMLLMMESFRRYSDELRNKGTPCDIARTASSLHDRAVELMQFDLRRVMESQYNAMKMQFSCGTGSADELKRWFGELNVEMSAAEVTAATNSKESKTDDFIPSGKPVHIIPGTGAGVSGMTLLGDELFVVRASSTQIDVYNATTFTIQRHVSVNGVKAIQSSLAACGTNNCVYMTEHQTDKVYRVDLAGNNTVTSWSVARQPLGLSVNTAYNVLVACYIAHKIQEFTTHGTLVREISLQPDVAGPWDVIELSTDQLGVIHVGGSQSQHRYCVVGFDGRVLTSYGGSEGSGIGQMCWPRGLAINNCGTVLVADQCNNRILVLNPTTFTATELVVEGGLKSPYSLHYDKSRDRLFIGELYGECRVVVLGK